MLLACRRPERVQRLVVVDIAPKDYFWPEHRERFAAMNALDLERLSSRTEAEAQFESRVPSLAMRKFLSTNLERTAEGRWAWQINLPVITAAIPELEKSPLRPEDRFSGPVRFIAGGKSDYLAAEDLALIRRHFPAADVRVLPNSGHNPHMEARSEFVAAVVAA